MTADAGEPGAPQPGQVIDGWRIIEKLGEGSFGAVYRVEKEGLTFALKLAHGRAESPAGRRGPDRSQRELECLLALRHPNIARVWSHGRWPHPKQGPLYLVMDYVEGFTLGQWKELCAPTPYEALVLFDKLAGALAYMEERGVKHRDLKPANIMVRRHDGQPVIVDYGAADKTGAETLTDERLPPGTPRHTSPEAMRFDREHRHEPHARYEYQVTDEIYAFGVTLYDVLTVPRLHSAPQYQPVISEVIPPKPAHRVNPRVPVALSELTAQLLSRDPAQRPVSFEVVRRKLVELLPLQGEEWQGKPIDAPPQAPVEQGPRAPVEQGPPRLARRKRWRGKYPLAVVGSLLTLVLGLSLWGLARPREPRPIAAVEAGSPLTPPASPALTGAPPTQQSSPSTRGGTVKKAEEVEQKAPSICARKQPPPADRPAQLRQWCRCAGIALAFASACTGAQLRPRKGDACPEEALAAMRTLGLLDSGRGFYVQVDEAQPRIEGSPRWSVVKEGPLTSLFHEDVAKVPKGSRLFGEVRGPYPHPYRGEPTWQILYTRLQLPGGKTVPVCAVVGLDDGVIQAFDGSRPGHVIGNKTDLVTPIIRWPEYGP
ncbi:MAG TPA: protein kinase [Myxococcaceae bacterium]|nr:protein kinase [Myxococcaceae bacterium]